MQKLTVNNLSKKLPALFITHYQFKIMSSLVNISSNFLGDTCTCARAHTHTHTHILQNKLYGFLMQAVLYVELKIFS